MENTNYDEMIVETETEVEETAGGFDPKFVLGVAGIAGGAILAERLLVKGVKKVKGKVTAKLSKAIAAKEEANAVSEADYADENDSEE